MEKSIYSMQYRLFLDLLREARESGGLTQADVALKLGVTQSFVSKCERGERRLDIIEVRAWCQALDVSFMELADWLDESCVAAGDEAPS